MMSKSTDTPEPIYFASGEEFRAWLEQHHDSRNEVIVGLHKKSSPVQSITWSDAVDQALCFGWIDSIGRRVDEHRYTIRFSPRKPGSNWSKINIAKVAQLEQRGLMQPAGRAAFAQRREDRSGVYSFENDPVTLDPDMEERFRSNEAAWTYFTARAPSYRRSATHWVMTAKREDTRQRRLTQLIENSEQQLDVPHLRRRT